MNFEDFSFDVFSGSPKEQKYWKRGTSLSQYFS
jgi:hypothetical protein